MVSLSRLFQVVAKREVNSGTLEAGLLAANNAGHLVIEPAASFEPERYERNVTRGTLSKLQTLPGAVPFNMSFGCEVAGHSTHSPITDPFWAEFLEACGFRQVAFIALDLTGAITSGPFYHGETVTGGTSNATGVVLVDTYDDATEILIWVTSGTFQAAETLTGGTTGATVTTAGSVSTSQVGIAWIPCSFEEVSIPFDTGSGDCSAGDFLVGGTSGARIVLLEDAIAAGTPTSGTLRARVMEGTLSTTETLTNESDTGSCAKTGALTASAIPSLSMALIEDSRVKIGKGCRGTVSWSGSVGEPMILNFEFQGAGHGVADQAPLTGVSYSAKVPPTLLGVTLRVGSDETGFDELSEEVNSPCWTEIEFDAGNEVSLRQCMSATTGIIDAKIVDKTPTGSWDPEITTESYFPWLTNMLEGIPMRMFFQWGTLSGTRPQQFTIWTPGAQVDSEDTGDRDGIGVQNLDFGLNSKLPNDAGDGEERELVFLYRVA